MAERAEKGKEVTKASQKEAPRKCPRCDSTNTKFCYFNNYSQSQPRHFCKACRRYWTEGGAQRNIPVGGGSQRKNNKRPRESSKPVMPTDSEIPSSTMPLPPPSSSPFFFSDERVENKSCMISEPVSVSTTDSEIMISMPPPPPTPFLFGGGGIEGDQGGMNFQPFHPGHTSILTDFAGFPILDQTPYNIQPLQALPSFLSPPQQYSPPLVDISTMFASSATGRTVTATSSGNGRSFWSEFNNIGGKIGRSSPPTAP